MSWAEVVTLFARLPAVLDADALFMVYGPFNIDGEFTSKAMPRSTPACANATR
jgi:hypothetical protein